MQWRYHKQERLYITDSYIISSDPLLIPNFNEENIYEDYDEENTLIDLENKNIVGNDRCIAIFKMLINMLAKSNINKNEKVSIIINTRNEESERVKSQIKLIIHDFFLNTEIVFKTEQDYHNLFFDIINKEVVTLIFSINYYSLDTNDEKELASVIVLSPFYHENTLQLFKPMPFPLEYIEDNIKTLSAIQQQKNASIKLSYYINVEKKDVDNILLSLRSNESFDLSYEHYSQGYQFDKQIGDYNNLNIYHLIALINSSNYQELSQYVFYKENENYFCLPIGKEEPLIKDEYDDINPPPFSIGTLLLAIFSFLFFATMSIIDTNTFSDNLILISLSFLFTILLATLFKMALVHLYLRPLFLQTLNIDIEREFND